MSSLSDALELVAYLIAGIVAFCITATVFVSPALFLYTNLRAGIRDCSSLTCTKNPSCGDNYVFSLSVDCADTSRLVAPVPVQQFYLNTLNSSSQAIPFYFSSGHWNGGKDGLCPLGGRSEIVSNLQHRYGYARRNNVCYDFVDGSCLPWSNTQLWRDLDALNAAGGVKSTFQSSASSMLQSYDLMLAGAIICWVCCFGYFFLTYSGYVSFKTLLMIEAATFAVLLGIVAGAHSRWYVSSTSGLFSDSEAFAVLFPTCKVTYSSGFQWSSDTALLVFLSLFLLLTCAFLIVSKNATDAGDKQPVQQEEEIEEGGAVAESDAAAAAAGAGADAGAVAGAEDDHILLNLHPHVAIMKATAALSRVASRAVGKGTGDKSADHDGLVGQEVEVVALASNPTADVAATDDKPI